jgi:hypothetical protein
MTQKSNFVAKPGKLCHCGCLQSQHRMTRRSSWSDSFSAIRTRGTLRSLRCDANAVQCTQGDLRAEICGLTFWRKTGSVEEKSIDEIVCLANFFPTARISSEHSVHPSEKALCQCIRERSLSCNCCELSINSMTAGRIIDSPKDHFVRPNRMSLTVVHLWDRFMTTSFFLSSQGRNELSR